MSTPDLRKTKPGIISTINFRSCGCPKTELMNLIHLPHFKKYKQHCCPKNEFDEDDANIFWLCTCSRFPIAYLVLRCASQDQSAMPIE
jgi:hypothetical protein